jgi:hypothetical protein
VENLARFRFLARPKAYLINADTMAARRFKRRSGQIPKQFVVDMIIIMCYKYKKRDTEWRAKWQD